MVTLDPDFFVLTLDEETDDEDEASSAIDVALSCIFSGGLIASPKSHNLVYPSASISTFSGFRLSKIRQK